MDGDARIPPPPAPGGDEPWREHNQIIEGLSVIRLQSWLLRRRFDRDQLDEQALLTGLGEIDRQTQVIDAILTRASERYPDASG